MLSVYQGNAKSTEFLKHGADRKSPPFRTIDARRFQNEKPAGNVMCGTKDNVGCLQDLNGYLLSSLLTKGVESTR